MTEKPKHADVNKVAVAPWLLLIHQLPPKPAYLRVKTWRRLQELGAIAVKNSVYVLPASEQALEDFQWVLREIEQGGGEGLLCYASLVDGLNDEEVRVLFDRARDADYAALAKALQGVAAGLDRKRKAPSKAAAEPKALLRKLRRQFNEISAIDFFSATGRMTVESLLSDLETRLADSAPLAAAAETVGQRAKNLLGKTWVTRRGVHIDRIACAWLVRRFIDPNARFKFVAVKDYAARPDEIRYDMFKAEVTHEGDKCSFEVLLDRIGLTEPALRAIAEIVHDIDLKDGKFARSEVAGIAHVIAGICMSQPDDMARIERGSAIFDDTYEQFRKKRGR